MNLTSSPESAISGDFFELNPSQVPRIVKKDKNKFQSLNKAEKSFQ